MKLAEVLLAGLSLAFLAVAGEQEEASEKKCPCPEGAQPTVAQAKKIAPHSLLQFDSSAGVHLSKLVVHQDHKSSGGLSLEEVFARYGGQALTEEQRQRALVSLVANTSLSCLDDRVTDPVLATPGGDLGEFTLGLAAYLQEKDGSDGGHPSQEMVDSLLAKYLDSIPASRPMTLCTDERAVHRLEAELPAENLDLNAPPTQAKDAGLLEKLTEVDNQGDSHFRLLLKQPDWYQLHRELTPMVLKAFYSALWKQHQDPSSRLYSSPKLMLRVLMGESNPQAFLEVACSGQCKEKGAAPMLQPQEGRQAVLVSHLDAASLRRGEMAAFFAKVSRSTPRKISQKSLHARMDRHSLLALETTGSRIAAGLPFFSMTYA